MTTTPRTSQAGVVEFEPAAVHAMIREGKARLVDVREPDEHRRERIPGAVLVPKATVSPESIPADNGVVTVLHCRSGRRSFEAAQSLIGGGRAGAAHMKGGIEAWKAAGLEVTLDTRAPMPVMQQTQIVIGLGVLASVLAGAFWNTWALALAGFMACGLIFAGLTGTCGLAAVLSKMPWNRTSAPSKPGSCCGGGGCAP